MSTTKQKNANLGLGTHVVQTFPRFTTHRCLQNLPRNIGILPSISDQLPHALKSLGAGQLGACKMLLESQLRWAKKKVFAVYLFIKQPQHLHRSFPNQTTPCDIPATWRKAVPC